MANTITYREYEEHPDAYPDYEDFVLENDFDSHDEECDCSSCHLCRIADDVELVGATWKAVVHRLA